MADEIDRAQDRDAQFLADSLAAQQRRADHARLPAMGYCHYCGEPLLDAGRFCDVECRDAWDYEAGLRRMRGVA
jgi:hypothetical protein